LYLKELTTIKDDVVKRIKIILSAILATCFSDLKNKVKDFPISTLRGETFRAKSSNDVEIFLEKIS